MRDDQVAAMKKAYSFEASPAPPYAGRSLRVRTGIRAGAVPKLDGSTKDSGYFDVEVPPDP